MNIWQFSTRVSERLLMWGVGSIAAGALLAGRGGFWRGFAEQQIGWGGIDALIALVGLAVNRQRLQSPETHTPAAMAGEARTLRRLLWINFALDIGYVAGGWLWAARSRSAVGRGRGWGVVVQGGFLLVFDLVHALRVPPHDHVPATLVRDATHAPDGAGSR